MGASGCGHSNSPPEDDNLEPMLHLFGKHPVLPLSERCIRDDCSTLLSDLEYAHLPGESLRLRRGVDIQPSMALFVMTSCIDFGGTT